MSASQTLSSDLQQRILELHKTGMSGNKIGQMLGINQSTAHKYLNRAGVGPVPAAPVCTAKPVAPESEEVNGDSRVITLPKTSIHTLEELLKYCEVDTDVWAVDRFICNKWEMGYKDSDDKGHTLPLFQVKAYLSKRKDIEEANRIIERLRLKAEKHAPIYPKIPVIKSKSGNVVELSLVDVHHGALIWGRETGGPDWDLKISERTYKDAFTALIARTDAYKPESALIVLGNDQQNTDNRAGTTEAGTPQNNDGRYQKVADVSLDCSIWAIDTALQRYGAVEVVMVPGNHDYLATWHLGRVLAAWYRKTPQVQIANSPNPRKYWEFGVNMLLFTHGNKGKLERYPGYMASEQPAMWGRTKWHEAHTADKHQRRLIEVDGATVRILPSLRPICSWTAENMFLGSVRAAEAYAWNKSEGLIGTATYSILQG